MLNVTGCTRALSAGLLLCGQGGLAPETCPTLADGLAAGVPPSVQVDEVIMFAFDSVDVGLAESLLLTHTDRRAGRIFEPSPIQKALLDLVRSQNG